MVPFPSSSAFLPASQHRDAAAERDDVGNLSHAGWMGDAGHLFYFNGVVFFFFPISERIWTKKRRPGLVSSAAARTGRAGSGLRDT